MLGYIKILANTLYKMPISHILYCMKTCDWIEVGDINFSFRIAFIKSSSKEKCANDETGL